LACTCSSLADYCRALQSLEGLDEFLDRDPAEGDDEEIEKDRQVHAKLILCLGNDMLPTVEDRATTHRALEALRADHSAHMQSLRSQIITE
jgi:hypothetical protein